MKCTHMTWDMTYFEHRERKSVLCAEQRKLSCKSPSTCVSDLSSVIISDIASLFSFYIFISIYIHKLNSFIINNVYLKIGLNKYYKNSASTHPMM